MRGAGRFPPGRARAALNVPFTGRLDGTQTNGQSGDLATVDLAMRFRGQAEGVVDVLLEGQPLEGGGIQMSRSRVTLGPRSNPTSYRGRVRQLEGNRIVATVAGPGNRALRVGMTVAVDGRAERLRGRSPPGQ